MKVKMIANMLVLVLLVSACGQKGIKDALNWPVNDFTYTNQHAEPFGLKDLEGKVWVADFIFTKCTDVCPPMTANMAKLQKMANEEGIDNIEFVSFSVDPEADKPDTLRQFASQFHADDRNWHFLTGYSQQEIESFALKTFKALVKKPQQGNQVIHGTDFYLVDQEGKIIKYYTGLNEIPYDEIVGDIKALQ